MRITTHEDEERQTYEIDPMELVWALVEYYRTVEMFFPRFEILWLKETEKREQRENKIIPKTLYRKIYDFHNKNWFLRPNLFYLLFLKLMPEPEKASDSDMFAVFVESAIGLLSWAYNYKKRLIGYALKGITYYDKVGLILYEILRKLLYVKSVKNKDSVLYMLLYGEVIHALCSHPLYRDSIFYKNKITIYHVFNVRENSKRENPRFALLEYLKEVMP